MVDRIAGKTAVAAPVLAPYPQTLLSVLAAGGLLHSDAGNHLVNGVFWESDTKASVVGNPDVTYDAGTFDSDTKTLDQLIAYTSGMHFELARYVELGTLAGGDFPTMQARALERFSAWESHDVAAHVQTYFDANDTDLTAGGNLSPYDGAAVLMGAIAPVYPYAPMLFSGRGPAVKLLECGAIELAGGIYAPDSGFAAADNLTGRMYATGRVAIWRSTPFATVVLDSPNNMVGAIVECQYYLVVDGPVYSATVQLLGQGASA